MEEETRKHPHSVLCYDPESGPSSPPTKRQKTTDELNEGMVREAIRKQSEDVSKAMKLETIRDELFIKAVICMEQKQQIDKDENNRGEIYASKRLLEKVIEREIPVLVFMQVLKLKCPQVHTMIQDEVEMLKKGAWSGEELDVEEKVRK